MSPPKCHGIPWPAKMPRNTVAAGCQRAPSALRCVIQEVRANEKALRCAYRVVHPRFTALPGILQPHHRIHRSNVHIWSSGDRHSPGGRVHPVPVFSVPVLFAPRSLDSRGFCTATAGLAPPLMGDQPSSGYPLAHARNRCGMRILPDVPGLPRPSVIPRRRGARHGIGFRRAPVNPAAQPALGQPALLSGLVTRAWCGACRSGTRPASGLVLLRAARRPPERHSAA